MKLETILAAVAAAFVPVGVFVTSHKALTTGSAPLAVLSIAGLVYSIPSVVAWAQKWTGHRAKAIGFTVMLEGIMTISGEPWLAGIALAILAGVNAMIAATNVSALRVSTFKVAKRKPKRKPKQQQQ